MPYIDCHAAYWRVMASACDSAFLRMMETEVEAELSVRFASACASSSIVSACVIAWSRSALARSMSLRAFSLSSTVASYAPLRAMLVSARSPTCARRRGGGGGERGARG